MARRAEIGRGPLLPPAGSVGGRLLRRTRGILAAWVGFALVTVLLPLLLLVALLTDLVLWLRRRKPWVAIRLVLVAWWFLFNEVWGSIALAAIWLATGGPFGHGSMSRRRAIYWLRPRWARSHLGAVKLLFGLRFEVEGVDAASPGPVIVMVRHASIVDNLIPETTIAYRLGFGIRYVIKRELEILPLLDIGGRWTPTNFVVRASGDTGAEIASMLELTRELGTREGVLIFPEGTRATEPKIARAKEIIRERQPEVAPLAEPLENLLPPRLGGPLALLERAPELDVVFCGHVGFDGLEYISDIWAGGLNGATIRVKFWRVPAAEIPRGERGRIEWLYRQWHDLDRWVGAQRAELGGSPASKKVRAAA